MRYSLAVVTPPSTEPVTLLEAKMHLRIEDSVTAEDAMILALIQAAREWAENWTRRSFVSRSLAISLDGFPCGHIKLPRGPATSVDYFAYQDANDNTVELDPTTYYLAIADVPTSIKLVNAFQTWPTPKTGTPDCVVIIYTAGYATLNAIPKAIKAAILMMVGYWFETRMSVGQLGMAEVPMGAKMLLTPYVIQDFDLE